MSEIRVPCCCLIPGDVALADMPEASAEEAKRIAALTKTDLRVAEVPFLADKLLHIFQLPGSPATAEEGLLAALLEVNRHLRQSEDVSSDEESAPFVMLIPRGAAPVLVGARGVRVQRLMKESGAEVSISRDVIGPLQAQPVIVRGSLTQVADASIAIHQVVHELATRSRLPQAEVSALFDCGTSQEAAGMAEPLEAAVPQYQSPATLLISMELAGWIIGKRGQRIQELQQQSGARINIENRSAPGLRCGDRLLEISGPQRDAGVRAAFAAISEARSGSADASNLIVPADAVGFVIGRGGQSLNEIRTTTQTSIDLDEEFSLLGGRVAIIQGAAPARMEAVLAVLAKVDHLGGGARERELQREPQMMLEPREKFSSNVPPWPEEDALSLASGIRQGSSSTEKFTTNAWPEPREKLSSNVPPWSEEDALSPVDDVPGAVPLQQLTPVSSPAPSVVGAEVSRMAASTASERALIEGIKATGALSHTLTIRVPSNIVAYLDEISERSGARVQMEQPSREDPGHRFITVVGRQIETSMAALYIQQAMELQVADF